MKNFEVFGTFLKNVCSVNSSKELRELQIDSSLQKKFKTKYTLKYLFGIENNEEFQKELFGTIYEVFIQAFFEENLAEDLYTQQTFLGFLDLFTDFLTIKNGTEKSQGSKIYFSGEDEDEFVEVQNQITKNLLFLDHRVVKGINKLMQKKKNHGLLLKFFQTCEIWFSDLLSSTNNLTNRKMIKNLARIRTYIFELKKMESINNDECVAILDHLKQYFGQNKDEVIVSEIQTNPNGEKQVFNLKTVYLMLLKFNERIGNDEAIQDLVIEVSRIPNLFKPEKTDELYQKYSTKYPNNMMIQSLVPENAASKNICSQGYKYFKSNNLDEAEQQFLLAIEKDAKNLKAYRGLKSVYTKQKEKKKLAEICAKIYAIFESILDNQSKLLLLEESYKNDPSDMNSFVQFKILSAIIPIQTTITQLRKVSIAKDKQITELTAQANRNSKKVMNLNLQLATMKLGTTEKKVIFFDGNADITKYFEICAVPFKIVKTKLEEEGKSLIKIYHLFLHHSVQIDGTIKMFETEDEFGIKKKCINQIKLNKTPIGKTGWKLFIVDTNLIKSSYLNFEIEFTFYSLKKETEI